MNIPISFPPKAEYRICAENVTLTLLVTEEGPSKNNAGSNSLLHTHAAYELFACMNGIIHLQTQHGVITLCAGDVAIVPPGLLHYQLFDTPDAQWCVFDFICTERRKTGKTDLMHELSALLNTNHFSVVHGAHEETRVLSEIASSTDDTAYLSALRFLSVLSALSRHPLRAINGNSIRRTTSLALFPDKDIDRLSKLDILVNSHFTDDLTLARAAELLFISERQLQRITQKEYGMTFATLLCQKRLEAAKTLLETPTLSIEQVAMLTGFPSRAALTRAMQKEQGVSPSVYREKLTPSGD